MNGSGKGGNNQRNRQRFSKRRDERKKQNDNTLTDKNRMGLRERPRWTAPVLPSNPITAPDCPWCGKQIKDITTAISDKDTGRPVHFDCVLNRISNMENLETNDSICYIGGGRFGVIHYNNPPDTRNFSIKKIYEWEIKEENIEWRKTISEYFSIT